MKITFTYGDTVKIILTQDDDGYYIYTPKNDLTSSIKFFSVKDAILFFSEFLPINAYNDEEDFLNFKVTLEYPKKKSVKNILNVRDLKKNFDIITKL